MRVFNYTFTLSFKIKPSSYSKGKHCIFYFTEGESQLLRLSACFDGDGKLILRTASINFTTKDPLPLNKWSSFKISQSAEPSKKNIYLNNEMVSTIEHNTTESTEFIQVYLGHQRYPVQDGYIKDLQLSNGKGRINVKN